jgi:hypothetical protein
MFSLSASQGRFLYSFRNSETVDGVMDCGIAASISG